MMNDADLWLQCSRDSRGIVETGKDPNAGKD